ncbi:MAG TPA: hypothetical protein PKD26_02780 [Pyrinomonadaceae bacterium]|nr:hypothetical protein [Pyrinomonadaceae bacterium]
MLEVVSVKVGGSVIRGLVLPSLAFLAIAILAGVSLAGPQSPSESDDQTLVIESSPDMEIISFSKRVVVKNEAKGVLVFGADVVVEGNVPGDVAAIGGSVIQRDNAFIGGDVIVIGGKYSHDSANPLRNEGKQTIIFAAYEEELRNFAQNPAQIFSPAFSLAFFAQRLLSLLFWFLLSMAFVTIAPGAIGRAVARLKLYSGKVFGFGIFIFLVSSVFLIAGFSYFPSSVNAVLAMMAFVVLTLAYVFGRVALHVALGKAIQKYVLSDRNRSDAICVLLGVAAWTILFSIPYVWTLAFLAMFSAGIGLVATARQSQS